MAMHVPRGPGFAQMMKEGARHISGLEEAVLRNIDACKELAGTTRSAYGPYGQNKIIINHLEKLFITNDAATIIRELEVQHPAAKMLVLGSQQQEQECGDGTNFVLVFAGALLENAEQLLRMGLSVTEVIEGYEQSTKKALDLLDGLVIDKITDKKDQAAVLKVIRTAIMSKQYGLEDFLGKIVTEACISVMSKSGYFNVDNVRICKIAGQGVQSSSWMPGMVFKRQVEGDVSKTENCKVVVYSCPLDIMQTETKGTVLIKTANDLMNYSQGEENQIEQQVKAIVDAGCKVAVTGGKVGELYLHYANKFGLMVVRVPSKFDVRRLCKAIGATALPRMTAPTSQEIGYCASVYVDEIGDSPVIVFKQESDKSPISTIVIRGATDNLMDDIERAIDDGVNAFKALTKDNRLLAGAGATEVELAKEISSYGEKCFGLEQYAIQKYAESLDEMPRAIAGNAGIKASEVLSMLHAAHQKGKKTSGVDIEAGVPAVKDSVESGIIDLYATKYWGIKFASAAACTVLRVDQIIMAKPAGGPKVKENKEWDED
jgi:T-complex protein 1 subunit theta